MDDSFSNMVVTAPALAGTPNHLYLAWTDTDTAVALLTADTRNFFAPMEQNVDVLVIGGGTESPEVALAGSATSCD